MNNISYRNTISFKGPVQAKDLADCLRNGLSTMKLHQLMRRDFFKGITKEDIASSVVQNALEKAKDNCVFDSERIDFDTFLNKLA